MVLRKMKKIYLALFVVIIGIYPAFSFKLTGGVTKEWSIDSARSEAFLNAKQSVNVSNLPTFDPNYEENIKAINSGIKYINKRKIAVFGNQNYAVQYLTEKGYNKAFYYNQYGQLEAVDYRIYPSNIQTVNDFDPTSPNNFPIKIYKYSYPAGELLSVSIEVKRQDQYVFSPSKDIQYHWIGNYCYDADGNVVNTRKLY